MAESEFDQRVAAVRRFNRFYTRQIGLLQEGYLESPFSLTEVRVLYELAHRERPTATELGRDLGLDAGYLSRILRGFEKRRPARADALGARRPAEPPLADAARTGRLRAARTRARATRSARCSAPCPRPSRRGSSRRCTRSRACSAPGPSRRRRTCSARTSPATWAGSSTATARSTPRSTAGTSASRRWSRSIVATFIERYDPKRERCWIAEKDGEIVGSVFLVAQSKTVAKLRLLLVEPKARGLGIGARLVDECIALRAAGGLPEDHALDQQHPARRPAHLRGGRLPPRPRGAAHELRPRPRRARPGTCTLVIERGPAPRRRRPPPAFWSARPWWPRASSWTRRARPRLALLRYAIGFCCLLPVVLLSAERTRFAGRDLAADRRSSASRSSAS